MPKRFPAPDVNWCGFSDCGGITVCASCQHARASFYHNAAKSPPLGEPIKERERE